MFNKLGLLVLVAPLVSALSVNTPANIDSGTNGTITWTTSAGDPAIGSFELTNPSFNNALAIANNIDLSLGTLSLQFPIVPAGGSYSIQIVDISNITDVFAQSPDFSIGETPGSSGSATLTTASATGTVTNPLTVSGIATSAYSLPVTTSISTGTSPATGTGTGTASTASTTHSAAAAISLRFALTNVGSYAALLLSAVAGAAAIAL